MAQGYLKVQALGHLGADAVVRQTQSNQAVTSLRMACGDRYRDRDGNFQERTEWANVVIWGKRGEGLAKAELLRKGCRVFVEGTLRTRSYTAQDGLTRYVTEIRASQVIPLSARGKQVQPQDVPPPAEESDFDGEVPDSIPPAE